MHNVRSYTKTVNSYLNIQARSYTCNGLCVNVHYYEFLTQKSLKFRYVDLIRGPDIYYFMSHSNNLEHILLKSKACSQLMNHLLTFFAIILYMGIKQSAKSH
jgi:hypothetical protein